jgi:Ser/Thr protein kinase RdoA (MazF antagonist)
VVGVGSLAVHAEEFRPGGDVLQGDSPDVAVRYAEVFAQLMAELADVTVAPPLPNPRWVRWDHPDSGVWPVIEFLDDRHQSAVPAYVVDAADRARRRILAAGLPCVLGHADFEAQNLRWHGREVWAVHDWAVTWWHELPPHRHGTALQVADQLRRLHNLPLPDFDIGRLDPFVRLAERIDAATTLTDADRVWMRERLAELQASYQKLPPGLSHSVVHGDAWIGNVVATDDGQVVFLDLERCSIGPPEWDLVSTAVKAFTLEGISVGDYDRFVDSYGHDVTQWAGFETLRDIREFRLVCMAGQVAGENPARADEAALRLACLRGEYGPRPWHWTAVP